MTTVTTTQPASTSSLKQLIIRHPVAAFLGLVYGLTWPLFLPSFLSENGIGVLPFAIPVAPFLLIGNLFVVTLAAYIVTRVTQGSEGVRRLRRRYTHWRVGIGWYLLALLALPLADLLGASLWLGTAPLEAFAHGWPLLFTVFLPNALINAVLINLWEEGGWTGFLLPRLQERWGSLKGSVLVALAHGLYHVPLIPIITGVSDERIPPDRYWFYFVALFTLSIPVRVLFTWLWNSTRGSVIVVALVHGAFNTTTGLKFLPAFVPGNTLWVYGVYTVLALLVIALTKGRIAYTAGEALRRE